MKVIPETRSVH